MSRGAADEPIPLWGAFDGAPHPSAQTQLIGHDAAEQALLSAYRQGRMHHAWILSGPDGIGKATLAYRMARFLMVNPDPNSASVQCADNLAVDGQHPAARQTMRLAHPDVMVLQRGWNKDRKAFYGEIRVDDVRRAVSFFNTTAGAGGWRVCIIDTADEMNTAATNAVLKVLEEPPPRCLFLLLSSAVRWLLPTIRSRCRLLALEPLSPTDITTVLHSLPDLTGRADEMLIGQAAPAAQGSVRRALDLLDGEGLAAYETLDRIFSSLPHLDMRAAFELAEAVAGRDGEAAFERFAEKVHDWIHARSLQHMVGGGRDVQRWCALWEKSLTQIQEALVYNLDRRPLVLSLLSEMARASRT